MPGPVMSKGMAQHQTASLGDVKWAAYKGGTYPGREIVQSTFEVLVQR